MACKRKYVLVHVLYCSSSLIFLDLKYRLTRTQVNLEACEGSLLSD